MNENNNSLEKLKTLLKDLFQFDSADLDFGIYRIMNHKRKEIENFIEKDLVQAVEKEFERYKEQSGKELSEKIKETERKIKEDLGDDAIKNGQLIEKYGETKIGKEYLELKKQLEEIKITESVQNEVFNNLYNFFSRYYEDGDFISKRRYSSKNEKYAIPYSGEEVKLYWANFDQYYVKTGEVFKDYEFKLKGWCVIFRTIFSDVEAGNTKGDRRYFVLEKNEPVKVDKGQNTCLIQFEYRPLANEAPQQYSIKTKAGEEKKTGIKQDEINTILKYRILEQIIEMELKAFLSESEDDRTILEKHLYKYTRKISSDFFIHKNLKGFLERELDYFIKTEVIDLNNLEQMHIARARVVEGIGKSIIEFLAQIEEFQKKLWEKKKFVLKTDYVITIDRIPEEFYNEILKNKAQLKEWEDLGFGKISGKEDLTGKNLPVDTKHFDDDFKERLLEELSEKGNLDDLIDGILIKSENYQALNLIIGKFREKIQCIYADPPFNTGTNEFLYKNNYLDSSWITMMYDRLELGKRILKYDGSIYVRIDYHGNHYARSLMDMVFGGENFRNEIVVKRTMTLKGESGRFHTAAESVYFYGKNQKILFNGYRKQKPKSEWEWVEMHLPGTRKDEALLYRDFFGKRIKAPEGRRWALSQEALDDAISKGLVKMDETTGMPKFLTKWETIGSNWSDISGYSPSWGFTTENSEQLLQRVIETSSNKSGLVLDYFLGSGTTTAVAHKLGRKWIGVEMGDYFEDIPLKRMKMVLAGDKSGISKEVGWQGGGFFKYHYLEQYEDTLHNIEFPNEEKGQMILDLFGKSEKDNEYMMKYFLQYETEGSPSLLNLKQFETPFEYKLRIISGNKGEEIVNVDLVETFNYLIGLKVGKYKFLQENGRKYAIVLGEKGNRKVAVVWRSTNDIDLEKDKEIINKAIGDYNPEEIFINGDALYPKGYKVIETEFKALMGV